MALETSPASIAVAASTRTKWFRALGAASIISSHAPRGFQCHPAGELVVECPGGEPQEGFQIGGYYSHMWFERQDQLEANGCLEWMICSDGEFPSDTPETQFHLCDFRQLEQFVAFWGKELRRRGWVSDEGDDE